MNDFNEKLLKEIEKNALIVSGEFSNFDISIKLKDKLDSEEDFDISLMSTLLNRMIEEIRIYKIHYQEQLEAMSELQNNYWKQLEEASKFYSNKCD